MDAKDNNQTKQKRQRNMNQQYCSGCVRYWGYKPNRTKQNSNHKKIKTNKTTLVNKSPPPKKTKKKNMFFGKTSPNMDGWGG